MASREFDVIIEPGRRKTFYWKDLWRFKGLFYYLAWRDILVRYKQTAIGVLWSVLRPFLTIVVFTLVFNKLGNFPSETGVPYAIMVCVGMLPWQFFSSAFSESANSLIANSNLLTKVYFPRLIVPASTVIVCLIDFLISFVILIGLYAFYSYVPDWRILLFPFFLLLATITAMGFGLFIAALNVKYRDFRYVIPFIVQFGLYISPVGFSSNIVYSNEHIPQILKYLYALNPMVGVIDGFRWSMLGGSISLHVPEFLSSIAVSVLFLFVGIWYFRKMERTFADVI
ncbi:MAG: ABC transporter permease [Bacteroidetes bacterium]|nr:ABC transporter permease [Bacteroidota bacterium]